MKIYKYNGNYLEYGGSFRQFSGYTLAEDKSEADRNIRCEECIDDNIKIFIEETKVIKLC